MFIACIFVKSHLYLIAISLVIGSSDPELQRRYECFIAIASRDDEERTHQKLSHVSPLRNAIGKKIEIGRRGVKNKSKHGMVRRAVRYLRHENRLSMSVQSCRARRQDAPEETEKSTLQPSLVWSSISRLFFTIS